MSKNKIILSVFVLSFIIPQITFASWWNPLTWNLFKKNVTQQVVTETPAPVVENNTSVATTEIQLTNQTASISAGVATISTTTKTFTKSLSIGMTDQEVKTLQTLLAKDKKIYPEGKVTGSFDTATKKAVQRFQDKYNLATPEQKLTANYGAVGQKTSEKLSEVFEIVKSNEFKESQLIPVPPLHSPVKEFVSSDKKNTTTKSDYYTIENNTIIINQNKLPKTIGGYSLTKTDNIISDSMVVYTKNNSDSEWITLLISKVANLEDPLKNDYKKYNYNNNLLFIYDKNDKNNKNDKSAKLANHYLWQISKGIFISVFYVKDNTPALIFEDGSKTEISVIDWFLKEFPPIK